MTFVTSFKLSIIFTVIVCTVLNVALAPMEHKLLYCKGISPAGSAGYEITHYGFAHDSVSPIVRTVDWANFDQNDQITTLALMQCLHSGR